MDYTELSLLYVTETRAWTTQSYRCGYIDQGLDYTELQVWVYRAVGVGIYFQAAAGSCRLLPGPYIAKQQLSPHVHSQEDILAI